MEPVAKAATVDDFSSALRAVPSRDGASFDISWDESDDLCGTHHLGGGCAHNLYGRSSRSDVTIARAFAGTDANRSRFDGFGGIGCEHRPVGAHGAVRGGWARRPDVRVLRHLRQLVASLWGRSVLTNCWGSDVGRAGVDRDGDRGSSAGRGEL